MERPAILTTAVPSGSRVRDLLAAVNSASDTAQRGWLIFLLLSAYYVVALGGVTDRDLLLNAPVSLPLLGIDISLRQFFLFAPPIYILVHFTVLVMHVIKVRKVYAFLQLIEAQELAEAAATGTAAVHPLRYEVSPNFFTQYLAGPPHSVLVRFFLQVVVWGTLVLLPVGILILFQVKFLPFHDVTATWLHRIYVLIDILLIALLGVFLPSSHQGFWASLGWGIITYPGFYLFTALSFAILTIFSLGIATVPGEWIDRKLAEIGPSVAIPVAGTQETRRVFTPTARLFEGRIDPATGRPFSPFHRNIVMTDEDLVRERDLTPDDISFSLRFRDLRYARLERTDLRQVDFTCADLTGAILDGAQTAGARFGCPTELSGAARD